MVSTVPGPVFFPSKTSTLCFSALFFVSVLDVVGSILGSSLPVILSNISSDDKLSKSEILLKRLSNRAICVFDNFLSENFSYKLTKLSADSPSGMSFSSAAEPSGLDQ